MSAADRARRSLVRLERIVDVVFAIVIWRLFTFLPRAELDELPPPDILAWFAADWEPFVIVPLGLVIVMIYWLQIDEMLSRLRGTDWRHVSLMVAQLFSILLFLYSIRIGLTFGDNPWARVIESLAAALVGVLSLAAWHYAAFKGRLLSADVGDDNSNCLSRRFLAEPITAVITVPFAFAGPWAWEAAWFLYPLFRYLFARLARSHSQGKQP